MVIIFICQPCLSGSENVGNRLFGRYMTAGPLRGIVLILTLLDVTVGKQVAMIARRKENTRRAS